MAVAFALFVNATAVSKAARKTAFIKASKTSIKTKKMEGYHFPCVYFWTKNGKIVSYATSA